MSWPVPSSSPAPVVLLPWGREANHPTVWAPVVKQRSRRGRDESLRKAKYGVAIVAGLIVVGFTKRIINSIPLVGSLTRPVLDLLPTIVVGPALGAALLYGHERGDLLAARHVVAEKAAVVRRELDTVVRDLSAEVEARNAELARLAERSQVAMERTARAAVQSVEEMERKVVPVLEREYRTIEAEARRALQDHEARGGGRESGYGR